MSGTRWFRRSTALATAAPLALILAIGCDPPRRGQDVARAPQTPPEAQVIPAGGLPPRVEPVVTSIEATRSAGEAAYRAGDFKGAKRILASYLADNATDATGFHLLGLAAWKSGDLRAAEKAFDKAIALDPTPVKSYLNSARVLLDQGRSEEALERVKLALARDSNSVDGYRVLARAEAKLGRVDDALRSYRRALVLDDQDVWTLNNLGMLYLELGDPDAALGPLARAVQLRSTAPVFQNNLGIALELDGYPTAAKAAFEAAVRADSGYTKAVENLKRLSQVVTDSTKEGPISLAKIADLFRLEIGMWRDSAVTPVPVDSLVPPKPDSVPPAG